MPVVSASITNREWDARRAGVLRQEQAEARARDGGALAHRGHRRGGLRHRGAHGAAGAPVRPHPRLRAGLPTPGHEPGGPPPRDHRADSPPAAGRRDPRARPRGGHHALRRAAGGRPRGCATSQREAGVAVQTVYASFASKSDVLLAAIDVGRRRRRPARARCRSGREFAALARRAASPTASRSPRGCSPASTSAPGVCAVRSPRRPAATRCSRRRPRELQSRTSRQRPAGLGARGGPGVEDGRGGRACGW